MHKWNFPRNGASSWKWKAEWGWMGNKQERKLYKIMDIKLQQIFLQNSLMFDDVNHYLPFYI